MELLNSKIDHPHYICDHTEWAVALCEMVGVEISPSYRQKKPTAAVLLLPRAKGAARAKQRFL